MATKINLSICVDSEVEHKLRELMEETGRSRSTIINHILLEHLQIDWLKKNE